MKHKISKLIITFGILATLPACIEVKDKDEEGNVVIQTIEGGDLVVDEPLFLHEGQFLSQDAFQQIRGEADGAVHEYEIKLASLKIGTRGVIYTNGHVVRFKVGSLVATSGLIASFPEGASADKGEGRSGGNVIMDVDSAEGILKFILRGEGGAEGMPGAEPTADMKGSQGAKGSDGGDSAQACAGIGEFRNRSGSKGKNGGKGKTGSAGQMGFKGGSSGTLSLTVKSSSNFHPQVLIEPGKGGRGGIGGRGGEGGEPGAGGKMPCSKSHWSAGNKGLEGDQGPQGSNGPSGENQTACISIQQNMKCQAESFSYYSK